MSFGRDWWVTTLPLMIQGNGGYATVRVRTYSGGEWLVKDVVKTHDGTVTLNVWTDARGHSPILSSTSEVFDFDGLPTSHFICITLDFNDIAHVMIVPGTADNATILH